MNLDLLLPFAGEHAVQSVVFAAEWQGELSDQTMLRVRAAHTKLQPHLPKVELQKMMQINLNPNEGVTTQPFSSLGGVVFQKTTELGAVSRQFAVNRQSCALVINDYKRWQPTLEFVMQIFGEVLQIIMQDKAINAIGLQYTDIFTWKDDPALLDMREVLNPKSALIPSNAFGLDRAWHSHHGFVQPGSHDAEAERLNNININVVDVAGERTIQITTAHRSLLKKPIRLSTQNHLEVIKSLQDKLHFDSKGMLSEVLSDAVAKKIKLK